MTYKEYVTEERIKFYLKDEQIYQYYFGDIELGKKYHSPIREKDPNPSLVFMVYDGKVFWKDFGATNVEFHDAIGFVKELKSFEEGEVLTRKETIDIIFEELVKKGNAPKRTKRLKEKPVLFYEVEYRELNDEELLFWNKLHLYRRDLDKFKVKAVQGLYMNCSFIRNSIPGDPMYVYLSPFRDSFKAYRPYAKEKTQKFKGVANGHIVEGWESLPKFGDICMINSSMKDTMVMTKAGYPGCNPTSENAMAIMLDKARELNARFKRVVIFFDNDKPGIEAARKLQIETGWDSICLPQTWAKDPSDLVMEDGNYFNLIRFVERSLKQNGGIF